MITPELFLICKVQDISDLEVFSNGMKKRTINVLALHRRKSEVFEISFYNKYISQIENLNKSAIYKIACFLRSEVYQDNETEKKTYFTHLVGVYVIRIGNT